VPLNYLSILAWDQVSSARDNKKYAYTIKMAAQVVLNRFYSTAVLNV